MSLIAKPLHKLWSTKHHIGSAPVRCTLRSKLRLQIKAQYLSWSRSRGGRGRLCMLRYLGERFADFINSYDYDGLSRLWHADGVWEIGLPINSAFQTATAKRQDIGTMLGRWDFFVKLPTAIHFEIHGHAATGYYTVHEIARSTNLVERNDNLSLCRDYYRLAVDHWRFARRKYCTIYADTKLHTGQNVKLSPADFMQMCSRPATAGASHVR